MSRILLTDEWRAAGFFTEIRMALRRLPSLYNQAMVMTGR